MPARPATTESGTVSVREALSKAMERLAEAGVDTPRLDSQLLLAWSTGLRREDFAREPERILPLRERLIFEKAVSLRAERRPLPYITGEQVFYGRLFKINRAVLIPRPETELLVEFAKEKVKAFAEPVKIADIGTGSGAIAVSVALELPLSEVWATDISPLALNIARKNIRRYRLESRVHVHMGDLFEPLAGRRFKMIVSNPPYVKPSDLAGLMPEVRDYEPAIALTKGAGAAGTDIHERLLHRSREHLASGGWIALEVGLGQANNVAEIARTLGYREIALIRDAAGIDRVVAARRGPDPKLAAN